MTYSKPEVQFAASALAVVQLQSPMNKVGSFGDRQDLINQGYDQTSQESTASAYEADE